MKFLVSTNVSKFQPMLGGNCTRVYCCPHPSELASLINGPNGLEVWLCEGDEITKELMDQWLGQKHNSAKVLLVHNHVLIPHLQELSKGRTVDIQALPKQEQTDSAWVVSSLLEGGRLYARAANRQSRATLGHDGRTKKTVLVVGAGIMGLVAAEFLINLGYQVRVVDHGPDPRSCTDWTLLGATHGGCNARMFTVTEADNYNERGSDIYQNMRQVFRNSTLNGGWSLKPPPTLSPAEAAWIDAFEQTPPWLADAMKDQIYSVNQESGKLWSEYMNRAPELFEGVEIRHDILRLYADRVALSASAVLNQNLGGAVNEIPLPELLESNPRFKMASESDELAGGFLTDGFTLGVHLFVDKLINRITQLGGEFIWNCSVQRIQRNASGQVTLLESQLGPLMAENYLISTGVTRNGLLDGTESENLMQGVLGIWLQVPNLDPKLKNSTKIHRRGSLVEDINVTVSRDPKTKEDILTFGGGYGYVGLGYPSPESPEMQALFSELEQVARKYFPEGYRVAKEQGTLWPNGERKFCIRPFTCTGLGVFEDIPTVEGGHLLITGGNNTGGFAQAPAIARAVCRAMADEEDPIHALFHPSHSQIGLVKQLRN